MTTTITVELTDAVTGERMRFKCADFALVRTCRFEACGKEFATKDPRQQYCTHHCFKTAKYRRWQAR